MKRERDRAEMKGSLRELKAWLESERTKLGATELMPLKAKGKSPLFAHAKEGSWTKEKLEEFERRNPEHGTWGLLLDRLCVVDADDAETVAWLEGQGTSGEVPEMKRCPIQATKKGRHYVFLRPQWADEEGYWDGARQRPESMRKVDLKTRCSTGTRGVLVVSPSEGKRWLPGRAPWDVASLEEMPRGLMEKVAMPRMRVARQASTAGSATATAGSSTATAGAKAGSAEKGSLGEARRDYVEGLLELLSKTRWEERSTWRGIATALKNDHGERYRAEWERHSRSSSKWEASEATKLWTTVARGTYEGPRQTTRTLARWAREDDPVGYRELRGEHVPSLVMERWDDGDRGLADIAHHQLGAVVKRVGGKGELYYFSEEECRWYKGDEGSVYRRVSLAVEEALQDVSSRLSMTVLATEDDTERRVLEAKRQRVAERIAYVRKKTGMSAVTALAVRMCQDEGFEQRLDAIPYLLGVANGVVDLRVAELRERKPEDMIYTVLETRYEDAADTSAITKMVLDCMAGDEEMAGFLKRLLGYGVTGDVSEEIFVIWTGTGRNGKGGITQTLSRVMGGFYKAMNSGLICERQVSNIDAERGKLQGARLAVFDELKDGEKLRTQEVQLISGGDGIPARPLYRDPMTIEPHHLCVLATNHMPELSQVLAAMVQRVLVVHFPVTFVDLLPGEAPSAYRRQKDPTLKARLSKNPEGVLRWLVEGAKEWYASPGLRRTAPDKVLEYSRRYFAEQDRLGRFLEERCRIGPDLKVGTTELLEAYNEANKDARMTAMGMATSMRCKGFEKRLARAPAGGGPQQCFTGLEISMVEAFEEDALGG